MIDFTCSFLVVSRGKPATSANRIWWPKTDKVPTPVRSFLTTPSRRMRSISSRYWRMARDRMRSRAWAVSPDRATCAPPLSTSAISIGNQRLITTSRRFSAAGRPRLPSQVARPRQPGNLLRGGDRRCNIAFLGEGHPMPIDFALLARILLTLATLGYGFATVIADFNRTHATNPRWTPHARFHVVWQISSYVGFGLLALALIWWPGPLAVERLYLALLMAAIVYAAFFAAVLAMPLYGGGAYDDNGYLPFKAPLPIIAKAWDVNITIFSVQVVVLAAATLSALAAG